MEYSTNNPNFNIRDIDLSSLKEEDLCRIDIKYYCEDIEETDKYDNELQSLLKNVNCIWISSNYSFENNIRYNYFNIKKKEISKFLEVLKNPYEIQSIFSEKDIINNENNENNLNDYE